MPQLMRRYLSALTIGLTCALSLMVIGCRDHHASSGSVQPARTFPASSDSAAKSKQSDLSRPIGCGGNPYYFDNALKRWVYFDARGKQKVSPNQPPCLGADEVLRQTQKSAFEGRK